MKYITICVTIILCTSTAAMAQIPVPDGWRVGAGARVGQSLYVGDGASGRALPLIAYKRGGFTLGIEGAEFNLTEDNPVAISALLRPRFFGLIDAEDDALDGIDRDITFDAGVKATVPLGSARLSFEALSEITDAHGGQSLQLGVAQPVTVSSLPFSIGAGLVWESEDLAQYLYGVTEGEARTGRPAYNPGAVIVPQLSLSSGLPLPGGAFLFGAITTRFYPDAVSDSPIVERDTVTSLFGGVGYQF